MNSYARPDVRYCRDYLNSNVNKVCLEFWRPDCWHCSSEKTDWRERASAPDRQSSHERNVNRKGKQNYKKPCYILNLNSPVGKSHLVMHMCFLYVQISKKMLMEVIRYRDKWLLLFHIFKSPSHTWDWASFGKFNPSNFQLQKQLEELPASNVRSIICVFQNKLK